MSSVSHRQLLRQKRKRRIRKKISGSAERPRLTVHRSARHIAAQVVDDVKGHTLVSVTSYSNKESRAGVDTCKELGAKIAQFCSEKNIKSVVFDKNGYAYHGRVKAFADGAREGGLNF